jgi:hypothetical protein
MPAASPAGAVLSARRAEPDGVSTAVGAVAIVEALHLALAATDRTRTIRAKDQLTELREGLGWDGGTPHPDERD